MANEFHIHKEEPSLSDVLHQIKINILSNLNCHNIGKILEFDGITQTCTVELMQIKQFNGMSYTPAPITQVPLIIYGAANGHITLPNPVGSICLLFFNDRDMDNFMSTGEQYLPDTTRMHDFTDCVAITTFKTLANPLTDYDERAVSIINEEIINEIKYNSFVKVYGNSVSIKSTNTQNSDETTINITPANILEITNDKTVLADNIMVTATNEINISSEDEINVNSENYTNSANNKIINHSALGGQINVGARVGISNTTQNLNLLIQAFLSACETIAVKTDTGLLTDASKAQFTNLKGQFEALLE